MLSAKLGDLPAIDLSRQPNVGDQDIGRSLLAPCKRLFAVARMDHIEALVVQRVAIGSEPLSWPTKRQPSETYCEGLALCDFTALRATAKSSMRYGFDNI